MNLREIINLVLFKNRKHELIKNNFITQYFPKSELNFEVDHIIAHQLMYAKDFFFMQVGANDGKSRDPIYNLIKESEIAGVLLEPIPFYFKGLQENYAGRKNITLLNIALHPTESEITMYKIDEEAVGKNGVPVWASGISTFDKRIMEKHCKDIPDYEKYLATEKVKCTTFESIIEENNISKIDLLLIDTEGFDYEIIKMIDFTKIKPSIIRFEHNHLIKEDLHSCINILASVGYKLFHEKRDITAYYCEN